MKLHSLILIATAAWVTSACQSTTPVAAAASPRPESEVFLADLDLAANRIGAARNVSLHAGYDNQPAFVPGADALWFVSDRSGTTDVYRYDAGSAAAVRVTATTDSEFSPTALPDGAGFSATHVSAANASGDAYTESQQVWRYSADGKPLAAVLPMGRIGYHAWLDASRIALFIVGSEERKQPNSLVLADLATGKTVELATNAGRSLGRTPDGRRISFVDKRDPANWMIVAMGPGETSPTPLVATPKGPAGEAEGERSEDYCWLPDGGMLMARGSQLLRWDGKPGSSFRLLAEVPGLDGPIKRLAVSRDGKRVAFVVQKR